MNIVKKVLKIIFDIIIYFLIIILSLYVLLIAYQKFIKKDKLLTFSDYYIFQIASSSMETNLHVGDYIVVKKTDNYKIGDIITFEVDDAYITHRIHSLEEDKIITKGDANDSTDDSIDKSVILGKVLFKLTILSFVVKYKFIIIAIIIFSFLLEDILKKDKEGEEGAKELKN